MEESYFSRRAILTSTDEVVDTANAKVMEKLPTAGRTYYSADSVPETHLDNMRPPEYLNKHNPSGLSHKLHLKIGAPVMLLRNMDRCEQSSSFLPISCLSFEPVLLTAIQ